MRKNSEPIQSISFSGCAWFLTYHLGVIRAVKRHQSTEDLICLGASSGSVAATVLAADMDPERVFEKVCEFMDHASKRRMGPVGSMSRYVRTGLKELLPPTAYQDVGERLKISISELPLVKNKILPQKPLKSNKELTKIIMGSCYIPIYYERPVLYRGKPLVDGGLTDNVPILNDQTVTVSPKPSLQSRPIDIGPKNERHLKYSLFPRREIIVDLYQQGFNDGEAYLSNPEEKDAG